jgi:hypothetical protein
MPRRIGATRRLIVAALLLGSLAGVTVVARRVPATALARQLPDTPAPAPPEAGPAAATPTRTPTPINIGNFVWDDLDGDGVQDSGEPGLANVVVQLWNAAKTDLLDSAVTNGSGVYSVTAPTPGDYRIRVVLPGLLDGFAPKNQGGDDLKDSDINPSGSDLGFTDSFTLASNLISTTTLDAGIIVFRPPTPTRTPTPINVGNFVWFDLDGDGIQEAGEPGLANVTVQLWNPERTELLAQTTTNANGIYTVVAPLPGDYRIRVLLPAGASFSPKDAGADDLKDSDINRALLGGLFGFSDVFTLAPNVISTTIFDAGLINVPPTPTGALATATPTPTRTPTATPPGTPAPALNERVYLPLVRQ